MYLNPQIRDTQDTFKIHMGYIEIHLKIRISSPTCGRAWIPPNPRDTCPACILHVSRMYSACIPHVFRMYLEYLCGYMYLACILHVSRMSPSYQIHLSPWMNLRYMYLIMYFGCIPNVSWSPLQIHVSRMYPACILHLRYVPLWIHSRGMYFRMYPICIPHMYLDVSWCIVMKSPRYTSPDVSWYVSSVTPRKRPRYMYLDVSDVYPKMYLGLVWDTCKIHAKYQDTCILLECNRAFKIHFEIHQDT